MLLNNSAWSRLDLPALPEERRAEIATPATSQVAGIMRRYLNPGRPLNG